MDQLLQYCTVWPLFAYLNNLRVFTENTILTKNYMYMQITPLKFGNIPTKLTLAYITVGAWLCDLIFIRRLKLSDSKRTFLVHRFCERAQILTWLLVDAMFLVQHPLPLSVCYLHNSLSPTLFSTLRSFAVT
jgi:hypothetical protein